MSIPQLVRLQLDNIKQFLNAEVKCFTLVDSRGNHKKQITITWDGSYNIDTADASRYDKGCN